MICDKFPLAFLRRDWAQFLVTTQSLSLSSQDHKPGSVNGYIYEPKEFMDFPHVIYK